MFRSFLVGVAFFLTAVVSLKLEIPGTSSSPVWPPSGIAIASVVCFGPLALIPVLIASFAANLYTFVIAKGMDVTIQVVSASSLIGVGAAAEAAIAWWLYNKWVTEKITEVKEIMAYVGLTFLACVVSAINGPFWICQLGLAPWELWPRIAATWMGGDHSGALIVGMAILFYRSRPVSMERALYYFSLIGFALVSMWLAPQFILISLLFLLWAAFRLHPTDVSSGAFIMGMIVAIMTAGGLGFFNGAGVTDAFLKSQLMVSLFGVSGMSFAVFMNNHRNKMREIIEASQSQKLAMEATMAEIRELASDIGKQREMKSVHVRKG